MNDLLSFFVLQSAVDVVADDWLGHQMSHAVPEWNVQNTRNHQQQMTGVAQRNPYRVVVLAFKYTNQHLKHIHVILQLTSKYMYISKSIAYACTMRQANIVSFFQYLLVLIIIKSHWLLFFRVVLIKTFTTSPNQRHWMRSMI